MVDEEEEEEEEQEGDGGERCSRRKRVGRVEGEPLIDF